MRVVLLVDNFIGLKTVEFLVAKSENIVGLFLHPKGFQNYPEEIIRASKLPADKIFYIGREWADDDVSQLENLKPDLILVVFWKYMLPENVFNLPPLGCINFHLSYLPYNRGKKPNVWPFIENTPAGVSLHYIDKGIDSGEIIARRRVDVELYDTAKSLYEKLILAFPPLFEETWPLIKKGSLQGIDKEVDGTFHLDSDFHRLDEIDLNKKTYPLDLINHLRAKTFPPHPSAYFVKDGKKIFVRVEFDYVEIDASKK